MNTEEIKKPVRSSFDGSYHEHKCPICKNKYEHANNSKMRCYGYETVCNSCYISVSYGSEPKKPS